MVVLLLLLQLLLWEQFCRCEQGEKETKAPKKVEKSFLRGEFAAPGCCKEPWKFDSGTGQCILDMVLSSFLKSYRHSLSDENREDLAYLGDTRCEE
uniref:Uncharacterized protein n=1 Tax=Setaria digitata TaxID=48799 RepID=A0A915PYA4_9BILA